MDFEPSDEEAMLADSVDLFGTRHYPASARLDLLRADQAASRERWREMAELGWLGLGRVDEGDAAANDGYVMALAQGFGRHLMLEPYVTRCVLAPALIAGSGGLAAELLDGIADGTVAMALALGEPGAGFALDRVATTAAREGSGFRLSGVKGHALDGADADWFLVPTRTAGREDDPHGISLFLVAADAPELAVERHRGIDGHRHAGLRLTGVAVAGEAMVGAPDMALPVIEAAVERAVVAHLAEALGSMEAAAAATLEHIKTRRQFGRPIGAFQALQHRMVDITIACEEARSMVYHAVAHLAAEPVARRAAIAAAKARVGQCGLYATRQAIQLHGGVGVSAELIVSHHLKRQMMLDMAYGNAAWQRARFAEAA